MEKIRCKGCGIILQSDNQNEEGYLPIIKKDSYCKRCFELKHYGKIPSVIQKPFEKFNLKNKPTFLITDVLNSPFIIRRDINKYITSNNLIIVVNKIDLLPKNINFNKISLWLKKIMENNNISYSKIFFVSSYRGFGMKELFNELQNYKKVNIIGQENAGKSSIINKLTNNKILTSNYPGTTRDKVVVNFNGIIINDYPGFRNASGYHSLLKSNDLKLIDYKKQINPVTFQLNTNQTIFIDSLCSISFSEFNDKNSITFFIPSLIKLHRTKTINKENIWNNDNIFNLSYRIKNFEEKIFDLKEINYSHVDFYISGLGFFTTKNIGQTIKITTEKNIEVILLKSLFSNI